jgi:sugar lactone lactonase YvrE
MTLVNRSIPLLRPVGPLTGRLRPWLLAAGLLLCIGGASAHPGSGIVVDRHGNVYFLDTGAGVWKIDRAGKVTKLGGPAYHWLAMDEDGKLVKARLPSYVSQAATVTRVGTNPTLIVSSDFPLTVAPDGSLYYPWAGSEKGAELHRLKPDGSASVVMQLPPVRGKNGELRWRNGIVAGPDGSLYFSEDRAVRRISPKGDVSIVADSIGGPGCGGVAGVEEELGPYCRGLAVDSAGTVFVAAAGCRSVYRLGRDGKRTVVLRSEAPWSPTSVAVGGGNIYVLEYLHTVNENRQEWVPRVKKVYSDGRVETIATIGR